MQKIGIEFDMRDVTQEGGQGIRKRRKPISSGWEPCFCIEKMTLLHFKRNSDSLDNVRGAHQAMPNDKRQELKTLGEKLEINPLLQ